MENQFKNDDSIEDYIFVGCMFLGMGIGESLYTDGVGLIVCMGVGFLLSAVYKEFKVTKKQS